MMIPQLEIEKKICMVQSTSLTDRLLESHLLRRLATFSRFGRSIEEELTFHHFHQFERPEREREGWEESDEIGQVLQEQKKTGFERSKIFSHLSKGIVIYLVLALTRELYEFRDFFPKSTATENNMHEKSRSQTVNDVSRRHRESKIVYLIPKQRKTLSLYVCDAIPVNVCVESVTFGPFRGYSIAKNRFE